MSISLAFPDETYTESKKPSVNTLKTDLNTIEQGVNFHIEDTDNPHGVTAEQVGVNVNALAPTGSILPFAGSSAPTGFLIADGASLLRADYSALFSVIGTTYGTVDGTHFTLPNLKGKVVVGLNASETEFDALGETGGEKTHLLTGAESGTSIHNHFTTAPLNNSFTGVNYGWSAGNNAGGNYNIATTNSSAADASSAHNNLQPYITMNYIIKF